MKSKLTNRDRSSGAAHLGWVDAGEDPGGRLIDLAHPLLQPGGHAALHQGQEHGEVLALHLVQLVDNEEAGTEVGQEVGDSGAAAGAAQGVLGSGQVARGLQEKALAFPEAQLRLPLPSLQVPGLPSQ